MNAQRIMLVLVGAALATVMGIRGATAHCQVPCGIYDDPARIAQMKEDARTIAKAVTNINQLSGKHDSQAFNQAARWVATKEAHASHIITTISEYFLTQKVKPAAAGAEGRAKYLETLARCHAVMVAAMKTKQSSSAEAAQALDAAVEALGASW